MEPFSTDEEQYKEIRKRLKKELDRKRYVHTKGVADTAVCMAMAHGYSLKEAYLAGLLHDNAKCIPTDEKKKLCKKYKIALNNAEEKNPELIHAKLGSYRAQDIYHVENKDIISAIACHTTGKPNMTMLDQIIYIADYIEPNRKELPLMDQIRRMAFVDLDKTMLLILESTLEYLVLKDAQIDEMTQKTFEFYKDKLATNK